jgi:protein-L-isoaspartate(D-aspartate) O-methyltransferase
MGKPIMTSESSFETMRHAMVASQLRTNAVNDARVVAAMGRVPREAFLPEDGRRFAYLDSARPLGGARWLNPPIATGRLLTQAQVGAGERVLLIGAATGYSAAILSELAASVVAVEEDAALLALAREALADRPTVTLVEGPLTAGAPEAGPYDLLFIDGAVERVPDALLAQLKPGGRIATGLVDQGVTRLATGSRSAGGFGLTDFADVECVVLPGFEQPRAFTF